MLFAYFDTNGRIESAHNDSTVVDAPVGSVELTEAEWASRFDLLFENGVLSVSPRPAQSPTIDQIRSKMQCTNSQFRRALTQLGWRQDVETAVAAAGPDIQDMYEYDTIFYRSRAEFSEIAAVINKTEFDIDTVFEAAVTLP